MKTAIDRLNVGEEKEVSIFDFDGCRSKYRFVCPECGEYVFASTGKINSFKHYKGKGIDCDLRVDSADQFTFFQRVGLPIYLINNNGEFALNIGFYGLGEKLLSQAQEKSIKVIITENTSNIKNGYQYFVDNINFFHNDITLKSLDFIPRTNKNYQILFNVNDTITNAIEDRWSNFADGFSILGGLFSYSESKGKKIRSNDTITTNTDYYLLRLANFNLNKDGLDTEKLGNLKIDSKYFDIFRISILPKNKMEFKNLEDFFWSNFKLKLLYKKPEIVQLWPPAIKKDDVNDTVTLNKDNYSFFCKIDSDIENTKVYSYVNKNYDIVRLKEFNKQLYIEPILLENLLPLTVNRKFLANAQLFKKNKSVFKSRDYKINVNGIEIGFFNKDTEYLEIDDKIDDLLIKSDLPISILSVENNMDISHESIDCMEYEYLKIPKMVEEILIYSKSLNLIILRIKRIHVLEVLNENGICEKVLFQKIRPFLNEKTVAIPLKYRLINTNIKKHTNLYKILKRVLVVGKIQPSVLEILKSEGVI